MCECMHGYMHICVYAYIHIHRQIDVCIHVHKYVHKRMCAHVFICTCICVFSLSLLPKQKLHIIRHQGCVATTRDCRLQTGYNLSSQFAIAEVSWILRLLAEVMEIA